MKKSLLTFLITLGAWMPNLSAKEIEIKQVKKLEEIKPDEFASMIDGNVPQEMHDIAIEVSKNTKLPLKLLVKGDLIRLNVLHPNGLCIEVLQKFYINHDGKGLLFSLDLKEFKPIADFIAGNIVAEVNLDSHGLVAGVQGDFSVRR